jgi:hypothetical protein
MAWAALIALACGCGDTEAPASSDLAVTADSPCTVIDMTGEQGLQRTPLAAEKLASLHDPVARLVLGGGACPQSFGDIQRKLNASIASCQPAPAGATPTVPPPNAAGGAAGVGSAGPGAKATTGAAAIRSHLISETINRTDGAITSFRNVVSRSGCDASGVKEPDLLLSMFGDDANTTKEAIDNHEVEMIGFDEASGVFNYYSLEDVDTKGRAWRFFGSSNDLVAKGPGEGSFPNQARRCANCHVNGGLIQKELESPWMHWDQGGKISSIAAAHTAKAPELLGVPADGATVEASIIRPGNGAYLPHAITFRKEQLGFGELLQPLFCTGETNLQQGAGNLPPKGQQDLSDFLNRGLFDNVLVRDVISGVLDDTGQFPAIKVNGSFALDATAFASARAKANQRVVFGGTKHADGTVSGGKLLADETMVAASFPGRAAIEDDMINRLIQDNVIDAILFRAVLMVDFTRPAFSDTRCDLLTRLAPALDSAHAPKNDPAGLRAAFKAALASPASGSPEAALLANLDRPVADIAAELGAFQGACIARAKDPAAKESLANDVMAALSVMRRTARKLPVMEFSATLPVDDLDVAASTHFDSKTCKLVSP